MKSFFEVFLSLAGWIRNGDLGTFRYCNLLKCTNQVSPWVSCTVQGRIKCLIGSIEPSISCLASGVLHLLQNPSPYVCVWTTSTALRINSGNIFLGVRLIKMVKLSGDFSGGKNKFYLVFNGQ